MNWEKEVTPQCKNINRVVRCECKEIGHTCIFEWYFRYLPPANEVWGKVIFLHLFVILFMGGGHAWHAWQGGLWGMYGRGVHGRGHAWPGGHAWQGGMRDRGACVAGGHAWPEGCVWSGGHALQGVCMAGGCMAKGGHVWQRGGMRGEGEHAWQGVCVAKRGRA